MAVSKNPYKPDPNDPRWRAVEVRREYERQGYEVQNGKGVFDPKTGVNILKKEHDEGAKYERR